jgi:hypothetical protein
VVDYHAQLSENLTRCLDVVNVSFAIGEFWLDYCGRPRFMDIWTDFVVGACLGGEEMKLKIEIALLAGFLMSVLSVRPSRFSPGPAWFRRAPSYCLT